MKKEETQKQKAQKRELQKSVALARIKESEHYWALEELFNESEKSLESVLSIQTKSRNPHEIATDALANQKALAFLRQKIRKPIETAKNAVNKKKSPNPWE